MFADFLDSLGTERTMAACMGLVFFGAVLLSL